MFTSREIGVFGVCLRVCIFFGMSKINRSLNLPRQTWDELDAIAKHQALAPAEIYRQCMLLGLVSIKEQLARALVYETKTEVLKKLKQRQGEMESLIDKLADRLQGEDAELVEELRGFLKD